MGNILICDDSKVACQLLKNILPRSGHRVTGEAHTAKDLLEKMRSLKPDLVTLDLVMPKKGGIDSTQAIRSIHSQSPETKILIISSLNQDLIKDKMSKLGCDAFLNKPFEEEELLHTVDLVLGDLSELDVIGVTRRSGGMLSLTEMGKDALTEVCNVAVGNASGILSKYLSKEVDLSVPEVSIQKFSESMPALGGIADSRIYFMQRLRSLQASGYLAYTLSQETAEGLISYIHECPPAALNEDGKKEIKRLAMLLSEEFLQTLNQDLGIRFTALSGKLVEGDFDMALSQIDGGFGKKVAAAAEEEEEEEAYRIVVAVEMKALETNWKSLFILILNHSATATLLQAVRAKLLKDKT